MKITTTFHKKVPGAEEYSSLGYHLTIEATPDAGIAQDRDRLAEYTRRLFAECRERVEAEISRSRSTNASERPEAPAPVQTSRGRPARVEARAGRPGAPQARSAASPKQINFLRSLGSQAGLDYQELEELSQERFHKAVRDLSVREASRLIDELRS